MNRKDFHHLHLDDFLIILLLYLLILLVAGLHYIYNILLKLWFIETFLAPVISDLMLYSKIVITKLYNLWIIGEHLSVPSGHTPNFTTICVVRSLYSVLKRYKWKSKKNFDYDGLFIVISVSTIIYCSKMADLWQ